jgi:hypothetical protein
MKEINNNIKIMMCKYIIDRQYIKIFYENLFKPIGWETFNPLIKKIMVSQRSERYSRDIIKNKYFITFSKCEQLF